MPMTVTKLHRLLGEQIKKGNGRKPVCISKETFRHNCESDGVTILEVCTVALKWVPTADDDGGGKYNQDGTEAGRQTVVLGGSSSED